MGKSKFSHIIWISNTNERSDVTASQRGFLRHLVEKREEIFALSREEEKASLSEASSFSLGKE